MEGGSGAAYTRAAYALRVPQAVRAVGVGSDLFFPYFFLFVDKFFPSVKYVLYVFFY